MEAENERLTHMDRQYATKDEEQQVEITDLKNRVKGLEIEKDRLSDMLQTRNRDSVSLEENLRLRRENRKLIQCCNELNNQLLASDADLSEARTNIAAQAEQFHSSRDVNNRLAAPLTTHTNQLQQKNGLLRQRVMDMEEEQVALWAMVKALQASSGAADPKFGDDKGDLKKQLEAINHREQVIQAELLVLKTKLADIELGGKREGVVWGMGRWTVWWQKLSEISREWLEWHE